MSPSFAFFCLTPFLPFYRSFPSLPFFITLLTYTFSSLPTITSLPLPFNSIPLPIPSPSLSYYYYLLYYYNSFPQLFLSTSIFFPSLLLLFPSQLQAYTIPFTSLPFPLHSCFAAVLDPNSRYYFPSFPFLFIIKKHQLFPTSAFLFPIFNWKSFSRKSFSTIGATPTKFFQT